MTENSLFPVLASCTPVWRRRILFPVLVLLFFSFVPASLSAQQGYWTWMHGSNQINGASSFGVLGVPAPSNDPPALYEVCNWTDNTGNFWLFGGLNASLLEESALWRFEPATNMWTWMNGAATVNAIGSYGVKGIPSASNTPGARAWGAPTWSDKSGNLWLFGGYGYDAFGTFGILADLWKYDISANQWTWMSGPKTANSAGSYGIQNVASAGNFPPSKYETNATWTDASGNLWLFGGFTKSPTFSAYNDLWKFDVSVNMWTWMKGPALLNDPGNYGSKGLAAPGNVPPARACYASFSDQNGRLWLYGGDVANGGSFNDLWQFDPASGMWTWMKGSNTPSLISDTSQVNAECVADPGNEPAARYENRACWTDNCSNFWAFGGGNGSTFAVRFNDLWHFNANSNDWVWVSGNNSFNAAGSWGTMTVPGAGNVPNGRGGSGSFKDNKGNLWLFGGCSSWSAGMQNDLWRFVPDSTCPVIGTCMTGPHALFSTSTYTGCAPLTVNFKNKSINASTYTWNFGDGHTSTAYNPVYSYNTPGTYTVTLLSSNGTARDSSAFTLRVDSCVTKLFIPNVFSPDGDGHNDVFYVTAKGYPGFHLEIYDRWGKKLFATNDVNNQWNGKIENTGSEATDGTYYYLLDLVDPRGLAENYKGFLTLIREH